MPPVCDMYCPDLLTDGNDLLNKIIAIVYALLKRAGVCYWTAGFFCFGQSLFALGIIFYAREIIGLAPATVGWLIAMYSAALVVMCLFGCPLFERFAPLKVALSVALLFVFLTALIMIVRNPVLIFGLVCLYGAGLGVFWPTLSGWLSQGIEGRVLGRTISVFNLSWAVGGVLGPLVCGWLTDRSLFLPLAVAIFFFMLAALFLFGAMRYLPDVLTPRAAVLAPQGSAANGALPQGGTPLRYSGWLGGSITFMCGSAVWSVFPMAGREKLAITGSMIGFLLLLRALSNAAGFAFLSRTAFWHFRVWPMLSGQILALLVFVGLLFVRSGWAFGVLFFLFGVSTAVAYANSQFLGVAGSSNRARRMALHDAAIWSGMIVGSVLFGWVYQYFSMRSVYGICVGLMLLTLGLQTFMARRIRAL